MKEKATIDLLSIADEKLSRSDSHTLEQHNYEHDTFKLRMPTKETGGNSQSEADSQSPICCSTHGGVECKDEHSLVDNKREPDKVGDHGVSDTSLHASHKDSIEEGNRNIWCSLKRDLPNIPENRICVRSESPDGHEHSENVENCSTLESENKLNGRNGEAENTISCGRNLKKVNLKAAPNCEKIIKVTNKADPFDLFSDEDTEPRRYQPIKRKLTPTLSTQDQVTDQLNLEALENTMSMTVEISDCKKMKMSGRVAYIHSKELLQKANQLTRIEGRADLVHSLIQAYGLLQYIDVIPPRVATESEILGFHSTDYIEFLREVSDVEGSKEDPRTFYSEAEAYGLSYDCPLQDGLFDAASLISGASIVAADTLISGQADIAINWYGGWHHAKRDSASGFCYINDIVLAILKLRDKFDKVLYVDIDLHHGDGVEEAFSLTSKVMTVSFHKFASGFFPGSGSVDHVGERRGQFYTVNIPLQDGIQDAEFCSLFYRVMKKVREKFSPEAVVLQCGADGLSEDQMASFNLTHIGLAKCVCFVLAWNIPTLLLGGGGYNFASTAKCWTFLTALAARRKLPLEIPEHEKLLAYGPDYQMITTAGNRRDCNSKQYLINLLATIFRNLEKI